MKGSSRSSGFVQKCVKIYREQETDEAVKFKSVISSPEQRELRRLRGKRIGIIGASRFNSSPHSGRHLPELVPDLAREQEIRFERKSNTSQGTTQATGPQREDGGVAVEEAKPKLKEPKHYAVMLHNDDYTTMEFVTEVLLKYFHKSGEEAVQIMLKVHHQGKGVAGIYTFQIAETKVAQVEAHAKEKGFPLKCTVEEL